MDQNQSAMDADAAVKFLLGSGVSVDWVNRGNLSAAARALGLSRAHFTMPTGRMARGLDRISDVALGVRCDVYLAAFCSRPPACDPQIETGKIGRIGKAQFDGHLRDRSVGVP